MGELNTQTIAEVHAQTVNDAIALAPTEPTKALTPDVYKALASLSEQPETSGSYQVHLDSLADAHKAFSKTEIRKQVEQCLVKNTIDAQASRDEIKEGVEPWGASVDGLELVKAIKQLIDRHCVLPDGASDCIALWLMASYCIDSFRLFPKLLLTSPQPRCGKSTLLEVIAAVVQRPLIGSNVSASVIFRAIEAWGVSVLLDEVDTFIHGNEELRGIINSGHTQASAFVWRVEGDSGNREPMRFSTWAAMVIAMIKTPPDTVMDRSVWVQLQRKTNNDHVERLPRYLNADCLDLRRQCQKWANDNAIELSESDPDMPASSNDRAEDNYRTLAAIADLIGEDWPARVRHAYKMAVSTQTTSDTADLSLALLTDIRGLIDERPEVSALASSIIVDRLNNMEERPWPTVTNGKALTQYRLSELLKPYGLKSRKRDAGGSQFRGYSTEDLKIVCTRYLSEQKPFSTETPDTGVRVEGIPSDQPLTRTPTDMQGVPRCTGVPDTLPPTYTLSNKGVRPEAYSDAVSYTRTPFKGGQEGTTLTDGESANDNLPIKSDNTGGIL